MRGMDTTLLFHPHLFPLLLRSYHHGPAPLPFSLAKGSWLDTTHAPRSQINTSGGPLLILYKAPFVIAETA